MCAPSAELSEAGTEDLIAWLIGRKRARVPVALLAREFRCEVDDLAGPLAELVNAGRLHLWPEATGGPVVILTELEARRHGLALDDESRRWRKARSLPPRAYNRPQPRTVTATDYDAAGTSADGRHSTDDTGTVPMSSVLDRLADHRSPDPAAQMAAADLIALRFIPKDRDKGAGAAQGVNGMVNGSAKLGHRHDPITANNLPRPTLILGVGMAWDNEPARLREDGVCVGCSRRMVVRRASPVLDDWGLPAIDDEGMEVWDEQATIFRVPRKLGLTHYCAACDRYGADAFISEAIRRENDRVTKRAKTWAPADGLKGGRG